MSGILELQKLLFYKNKRLSLLELRIAQEGNIRVDPSVIIEKEELEREIRELKQELDILYGENHDYENQIDVSETNILEVISFINESIVSVISNAKEITDSLYALTDSSNAISNKEGEEISDWDQFAKDLIGYADIFRNSSETMYINQVNMAVGLIPILRTLGEAINTEVLDKLLQGIRKQMNPLLTSQMSFLSIDRSFLRIPDYTENLKLAKGSLSHAIDLVYERLDEMVDFNWQIEKAILQTLVIRKLEDV